MEQSSPSKSLTCSPSKLKSGSDKKIPFGLVFSCSRNAMSSSCSPGAVSLGCSHGAVTPCFRTNAPVFACSHGAVSPCFRTNRGRTKTHLADRDRHRMRMRGAGGHDGTRRKLRISYGDGCSDREGQEQRK